VIYLVAGLDASRVCSAGRADVSEVVSAPHCQYRICDPALWNLVVSNIRDTNSRSRELEIITQRLHACGQLFDDSLRRLASLITAVTGLVTYLTLNYHARSPTTLRRRHNRLPWKNTIPHHEAMCPMAVWKEYASVVSVSKWVGIGATLGCIRGPVTVTTNRKPENRSVNTVTACMESALLFLTGKAGKLSHLCDENWKSL
jgi:hypothetical protein